MDENDNIIMSRIAFERMQAKDEKNDRWRNIIIIILIILLALTNGLWLYVWQSYDYSTDAFEVDVDAGDGIANYIGNDGDINNGKDYSSEKNDNEDKE